MVFNLGSVMYLSVFSKHVVYDVSFSFKGHAFNDQDRCVCAGYDNGDIKLFDLRNMSLRWEKNIKNGVSYYLLLYPSGFAFDSMNIFI